MSLFEMYANRALKHKKETDAKQWPDYQIEIDGYGNYWVRKHHREGLYISIDTYKSLAEAEQKIEDRLRHNVLSQRRIVKEYYVIPE